MKMYPLIPLLVLSLCIKAQHTLQGKLVFSNGDSAPFVAIGILQTYYSTTSNEDGQFRFLNVKPGRYVLSAKLVGYRTVLDTIDVPQTKVLNLVLSGAGVNLDDVMVSASRVNKGSGMAFSDVSKAQLDKQNLGQDVPLLLNNLPSVVISSDAGNGIGYTGIRIRGSDATRVNVTINGVPVNDAESQGTFWVNMPDLVSSVNSIQVQRGVGASTNGAGAFGASINLETNTLNEKPYAQLISTAGSYNTFRNTLAVGSGLLNKKFSVDLRGSQITSDGYIDRASSLLRSYYASAAYYGKKTVVKAINFNGWEKTYQAWYYVPEDSIKKGNRTFNPAGLYYDANGKAQYYANETDNYNQNNTQLHFIHTINQQWRFNVTAHHTAGKGYYEQFKQNQSFEEYGIPNMERDGQLITSSDMVRRLWLSNQFVGGLGNLNYQVSSRLDLTLGGGYNTYHNKHFGKVVNNAENNPKGFDHQYYFNTATKNDGNVYLKANFKPSALFNVFLDLQMRQVYYRFRGFDDLLNEKTQVVQFKFFNPKFGMSWDINARTNFYTSIAIANKEPNRDDFVQSTPNSRPKAEQLINMEIGWRQQYQRLNWVVNVYEMHYNNQLVLNGQINNVGAYNRVNAGTSFRRGLELELAWQVAPFLGLSGNLTLSQNKILSFTEYVDSNDVNFNFVKQVAVQHQNTSISFSPNSIAAVGVTLKPIKKLDVTFQGKHVGRQFLDNTSTIKRSIAAYQVMDMLINYTITGKRLKELVITGGVYNLFNASYSTNGYTYAAYVGETLNTYTNLAPAAPLNFLAGLKLKF